jgi:hypothetical protein
LVGKNKGNIKMKYKLGQFVIIDQMWNILPAPSGKIIGLIEMIDGSTQYLVSFSNKTATERSILLESELTTIEEVQAKINADAALRKDQ